MFELPLRVMDMVLTPKVVFLKENLCLPITLQRILIILFTFSWLNCRVEAKLEHWYITGLRQQNIVPSLVASIGDRASSLLKIEFETSPENSTADQSLVVESQPVEVIYDAVSENFIKTIFYFWHSFLTFPP